MVCTMRKLALTMAMVLLSGGVAMAGGPKPPATADLQVNNTSNDQAVVIVDITPTQQAELQAAADLAAQQVLIAGYQKNLGNTQVINGKAGVTFKNVLVGNHTVSAVYPDGVNKVQPGDLATKLYNVQQLAKSKKTTATVSGSAGANPPTLTFNGTAREFAVASFGVGGLLLLGLIGCRLGRKAQA